MICVGFFSAPHICVGHVTLCRGLACLKWGGAWVYRSSTYLPWQYLHIYWLGLSNDFHNPSMDIYSVGVYQEPHVSLFSVIVYPS